jgi:hypothetical protein
MTTTVTFEEHEVKLILDALSKTIGRSDGTERKTVVKIMSKLSGNDTDRFSDYGPGYSW